MYQRMLPVFAVLFLGWTFAWAQGTTSAAKPILAGPLAKLDIKDAKIETVRRTSQGTLNIGLHFGLDPGWFDPLGYYGPALHF